MGKQINLKSKKQHLAGISGQFCFENGCHTSTCIDYCILLDSADTHTRLNWPLCMRVHARTHIRMHARTCTHTQTCTHKHAHTHTHAHARTRTTRLLRQLCTGKNVILHKGKHRSQHLLNKPINQENNT